MLRQQKILPAVSRLRLIFTLLQGGGRVERIKLWNFDRKCFKSSFFQGMANSDPYNSEYVFKGCVYTLALYPYTILWNYAREWYLGPQVYILPCWFHICQWFQLPWISWRWKNVGYLKLIGRARVKENSRLSCASSLKTGRFPCSEVGGSTSAHQIASELKILPSSGFLPSVQRLWEMSWWSQSNFHWTNTTKATITFGIQLRELWSAYSEVLLNRHTDWIVWKTGSSKRIHFKLLLL